MLDDFDEIKNWYLGLSDEKKTLLWKSFANYLNDRELNMCMSEVHLGKDDLFEIHRKHGLIKKYQIYFLHIIRRISD